MRSFRKAVLSSPYGSLTFSSREIAHAREAWLIDVKGWYGGVGVTEAGPQRGLGHGSVPQQRRRTARAITLTGLIHVEDEASRDQMDRLVSGALWDGEAGQLTVTQGESTIFAKVYLDGEVGHAYRGEQAIDVQIPLSAPDPFLYSHIRSAQIYSEGTGRGLQWDGGLFTSGFLRWGESVPTPLLTNEGNAAAWPTFTVTGDFARGFRIINGNQVFEYPEPTYRRTPVVVSPGRVMVGNLDVSHEVSRRGWIHINPYSSISPRLVGLDQYGEGRADVTWRSTYI